MITRTIGQAMSTTVTRVNTSPERLAERLVAAEQAIAELRARLRQRDAEIADLHQQIATVTEGAAHTPPTITHHSVDGRPVITIAEAAKRIGVSVTTVWRYVTSGHWQAAPDGSRWLVYADQPLTRKSRR